MKERFVKEKIHNLNDLDEEQERVGDACRTLQKDIIDSFVDPIKIAGFVFSLVRARKSKKRKNERRKMEKEIAYLKRPVIKIQKVKGKKIPNRFVSVIKKTTASLIKWQLIGVGIYGVAVLISNLRKKPKVNVIKIKK